MSTYLLRSSFTFFTASVWTSSGVVSVSKYNVFTLKQWSKNTINCDLYINNEKIGFISLNEIKDYIVLRNKNYVIRKEKRLKNDN